MIDLSIFSDDELRYIIGIIPASLIKQHFKKNPGDFQKTMPGFRPTATIPAEKLFKELKRGNKLIVFLVDIFLEGSKNSVFDEIEKLKQNNGEEEALIMALSGSYFVSNPSIYFKLQSYITSEEQVNLLTAAVKLYKKSSDKISSLEAGHASNENRVKEISDKYSNLSNSFNRLKKEYNEVYNESKSYKEKNSVLEKQINVLNNQLEELRVANSNLTSDSQHRNEEIARSRICNEDLKTQIVTLKKENGQLLVDNETALNKIKELQAEIDSYLLQLEMKTKEYDEKIAEIETLKNDYESRRNEEMDPVIIEKSQSNLVLVTDKCKDELVLLPDKILEIKNKHNNTYYVKDVESLNDEIEYAIQDAKISDGKELLQAYLTRIYYLNKPIVGNRKDCDFILKLYSHMFNRERYSYIVFHEEIKLAEIYFALEKSERVVYLDNFIGNYNETILFSLLNCYKDKIFIISAVYDKMFMYLPDDFLRDCSYINLTRFQLTDNIQFNIEQCEEYEFNKPYEICDNAATSAMLSILKDLNIPNTVRGELIQNIHGHLDVGAVLTFSVLPYLVDVKGRDPFAESERLLQYYEKNKNSKLTLKWFANG